jgi:hypothetical protein
MVFVFVCSFIFGSLYLIIVLQIVWDRDQVKKLNSEKHIIWWTNVDIYYLWDIYFF